jgi:hypothetical protein
LQNANETLRDQIRQARKSIELLQEEKAKGDLEAKESLKVLAE